MRSARQRRKAPKALASDASGFDSWVEAPAYPADNQARKEIRDIGG